MVRLSDVEVCMLGYRTGKLVVVGVAGRGPRGTSWLCKCDCGSVIKLSEYSLIKENRGTCGCEIRDWSKIIPKVPKELKRNNLLTFTSWKSMLARCVYSKNKTVYKNVKVHKRWYVFANFLEDMGSRPSIDYSIDRVDPNKGYYKENCRWILKSENSSRSSLGHKWTDESKKKLSNSLRKLHAEGKIVVTEEIKRKIALGAIKRKGKKATVCTGCGGKSFSNLCQRCRGKRPKKS